MSTAEQLAEALEAVLAAVRFSNHPPDTVMAAEAKLEAVRKAGEQAREALAAYHSSGGQGVTPLTVVVDPTVPDDQVVFRQGGKEVGRIVNIGTPASTGGEHA